MTLPFPILAAVDPTEVSGWATAIVLGAWNAVQAGRAKKQAVAQAASSQAAQSATQTLAAQLDNLEKSKDALVASHAANASDWRARYEQEHAEREEYRKLVHDERGKANELTLRLQEENADLRARADIAPLLRTQEAQGKVLEGVAGSLNEISTTLKAMNSRLVRLEETP